MAEEENNTVEAIQPILPVSRVKKIVKFDKDINKINAEALFLITCSTELFLRFLAEKSADVALEKKRKTIKFENLRVAVKRHQPTSDFLLDSLPVPQKPDADKPSASRAQPRSDENPAPSGTRRIDTFYKKSS